MSVPAPRDTRFLCSTGIMLSPPLALAFEMSGALILQQLHYWLQVTKHQHEGFAWVYNTYDQWVEHLHVYSDKTIRNKIKELEDLKIIITGNFNKTKYDRTKWYRLDYKTLILETQKRLPNFRVFPQSSGNGYQMILEAATGPIPKNTQRETTERDMVKPSLHKKPKRLLPIPKPTGQPLEQPQPLPEKEPAPMPKEISSSKVLLARLQEKKGTAPAPATANTSASLQRLWRAGCLEHHPTGGMFPQYTMAQKGQFGQITRKLGSQSDAVVSYCLQEWIGFTKYVAGQAGLNKVPDAPQIGFMLKYAGEGSAFLAQNHHASAAAGKKPAKALEPQSVQLIAPKKPAIKLAPVKSPAHKPAPVTATSVPDKEDAASVEDILAWKPKGTS